MKINREKLHELYMQKVDKICEDLDWVTEMTPMEIVHIISNLLEENEEIWKTNSKN